jgi:hypothetical protein
MNVLFAPTELFIPTDTVCYDGFPVLMTGVPTGGFYTGLGVSGNQFYPGIAGSGWHPITYNYVDPQGCTNRAVRNIYVDPCGLSVLERTGLNWNVYPNPTEGELYFQSDLNQWSTYKIYDVLGQMVMQGRISGWNLIDVASLSSGVYTFALELNDNDIQTLRFEKH